MQPLIERAAKQGVQFFSKLFGVGGGGVRFEGILTLPYLNEGEVVAALFVLQKLNAHCAWVLLAISDIFLQQLDGFVQVAATSDDIDVRYRVKAIAAWLGGRLVND
jgi:hypothetical protein